MYNIKRESSWFYKQCDVNTWIPLTISLLNNIKLICGPRFGIKASLNLWEKILQDSCRRVKCNWAPVKLQSSELTLVTCDRLSHQTAPYDIKNTHSRNTHRSWPCDQVSQLAEGQARWAGGAAVTCKVGGVRVGMADRPSQEGWSCSCLFPCFPQIFNSGCQHLVGFYNGDLTF